MVDELVKRLRTCADLHGECALCLYQGNGCDAMPETPLVQAADAIEELSRENESLAKSVNEASEILRKRWIPVTERLPKWFETVYEGEPCVDGELVLVFAPKAEADVAWNDRAVGKWLGDRWEVSDEAFTLNAITHWMPLPQPPKEE